MSQQIDEKQVFTLHEVMRSIQKTVLLRYQSTYWIKAEMNKLNFYKHSGHCYPDLVEKKEGRVIAEVRSYLWKTDFERINKRFIELLKEPLKDGIKILFEARISFDTVHGLSLQILDIDPAFTLGDLVKEKQESIQKLKNEGIYDTNKNAKLPLLPQRIAVISVETSKGFADFKKVIDQNPWNYKFFYMLFPSLLQGDKAANDLIGQLRQIEKVKQHFDVVAIIRGGGGEIGLSCYNNYDLAKEIALFPLPVITGIGHSTNETVAELVAFVNTITPTKLAEYLIQKFHNSSMPVENAAGKIGQESLRILEGQNLRIQNTIKLFQTLVQGSCSRHENQLETIRTFLEYRCLQEVQNARTVLSEQVSQLVGSASVKILKHANVLEQTKTSLSERTKVFFKDRSINLDFIIQNIRNVDPVNVLKRGYSITMVNGKLIRSLKELKPGEMMETTVSDGTILSTIHELNQKP